jgi:hypothetical protein
LLELLQLLLRFLPSGVVLQLLAQPLGDLAHPLRSGLTVNETLAQGIQHRPAHLARLLDVRTLRLPECTDDCAGAVGVAPQARHHGDALGGIQPQAAPDVNGCAASVALWGMECKVLPVVATGYPAGECCDIGNAGNELAGARCCDLIPLLTSDAAAHPHDARNHGRKREHPLQLCPHGFTA